MILELGGQGSGRGLGPLGAFTHAKEWLRLREPVMSPTAG